MPERGEPPPPPQKSNKYGAPEKHEEVGDSSENSKASTVPATQSLIHDSSYHVIFFGWMLYSTYILYITLVPVPKYYKRLFTQFEDPEHIWTPAFRRRKKTLWEYLKGSSGKYMYDHCSEVLLHLERKFGTVWSGQNYQNTYKRTVRPGVKRNGALGIKRGHFHLVWSYDAAMASVFYPRPHLFWSPVHHPFWPPVQTGPTVLSTFGDIFDHVDRSELYRTSFPDFWAMIVYFL